MNPAMQALLRARAAWARHDHQLEISLYPDDASESAALDQQPVSAMPSHPSGGVVGLGDGLLIERDRALDGGVDPEDAACRVSSPHGTSVERVQPVVSHPSCNGLTPLEAGPQTGGALGSMSKPSLATRWRDARARAGGES